MQRFPWRSPRHRFEGKCSNYQWRTVINSRSGLHHPSVDCGAGTCRHTGRQEALVAVSMSDALDHSTAASYGLSVGTEPMEARLAKALPSGGGWQYEPKWDGFRCIAFKNGSPVDLRAKSGKPLGRYFPETVALLADLPAPDFVIDGELVIEVEGKLSFDALQQNRTRFAAFSRISSTMR
jgi:ATP-dependent DNA ligase